MDLDPIKNITDSLNKMAVGFFEHLPQIAIALGVLLITFIAARIVRAIVTAAMSRAGTRPALQTLAKNLIGIASWIIGWAIAITVVFPSIKPANLIAGLGLTSVAIGFAFKDIFENFLAGVIILGREKMRIGDIIECEDVFGRVERILIRETHVRETDGELVIVPNAFLFKNPVTIQTDKEMKRNELVVGIDYDADMETAREALQGALESCESVLTDETMEVKCVSFGGSSIDFKLLWWTDSQPKSQRGSYDEVAFAVKRALDDVEIGIPFPQTTLSFREETTPIRIASKQKDAEDKAEKKSEAVASDA